MMATAPDGPPATVSGNARMTSRRWRGQKQFQRALRRLPLQGQLQRLA